MSGYHDACRIEQSAMPDLCDFLKNQSDNGQFILTAKGRLSEMLQRTIGDAVVNVKDSIYGVEFKVEASNKHGNFYLETWSNLSRFKPGWMYTLDADILLYYFLESRELYTIPFQRLKVWAFGSKQSGPVNDARRRLARFPERMQSKHNQLNDTWGICVPIPVIEREVGLTKYVNGCEAISTSR